MLRTPRQMHGRRALAAAAAAGLLVSLFAPWYRETVVARGLTGLRTLTLNRSGWQAFSATELLILVVAALALLVVIGMPADGPERAPDRVRLMGVIVATLGALAFAVVLVRLTTASGTTKQSLDATMVAIRWGMFLALVCSAALAVAGLRLIRTQPAPARAPRGTRARRADRPLRQERVPRPERALRQERVPRPERTDPPSTAPDRRPDRTRPTRRSDRPRWDEPASSWLDLPD